MNATAVPRRECREQRYIMHSLLPLFLLWFFFGLICFVRSRPNDKLHFVSINENNATLVRSFTRCYEFVYRKKKDDTGREREQKNWAASAFRPQTALQWPPSLLSLTLLFFDDVGNKRPSATIVQVVFADNTLTMTAKYTLVRSYVDGLHIIQDTRTSHLVERKLKVGHFHLLMCVCVCVRGARTRRWSRSFLRYLISNEIKWKPEKRK